ncbi:MAG: IS1182 family transposase [Chloroflexi bacterium]|nr:IS1182 family transposase [Chloroflexota bacterium]
MLGPPKQRELDRPVLVSLERLIPADHFYRHLDATLDLSFVREWVADLYAAGGRPSIDPVVFFRFHLIMFFEGIRSERQLVENARYNLAHRWYLGYHLDEPLPDRSSLIKIRQRLGLDIFRRFFEHILDLCDEAGLVWGQELLADATKVQANADPDSLVPRLKEVMDDHLVALFGEEREQSREARETEVGEDAPRLLHPDRQSTPAGESTEADTQPARWDVLEECRLDPDRPPSGSYQRIGDRKVSLTDPDAKPVTLADGRSVLGYQDHYLVDGGSARIILHAFVTPGDVSENQVLLDQLRRTIFRRKVRPERVIADARYGTAPNVRDLEEMDIRAYIPLHEGDKASPYFRHQDFTYDAERDVYTCPQGEELRPSWVDEGKERTIYRARAAVCNACPLKERCTTNTQGRQVSRSFHGEYLDRVRGYYGTRAYQKAQRKRGVWVEPLFGEAKQWHGLRRFRLRGLESVNIEGLLVAAGQNLKRYLAAKGWGRRWGPRAPLLAGSAPSWSAISLL